jgi:UDP-GlcNAc:undecaprenyl-phosphate GlcNAc-1-phosphate transferase
MDAGTLKLLILALISFFTVFFLLPRFFRIAVRSGFVDQPGGRKGHERRVPPIGGLLIFPVFMILAMAGGAGFKENWPLFCALVLILATGVLDDRLDIKASLKFAIQFIAALLIVLPGGALIISLGNFIGTGPLYLGWMAVPFTIVCVMLLINAINMIDGLDGLAGGLGLIALFWLAASSLQAGESKYLEEIALLMGALGGFLYSNMRTPLNKKAKVFLGDSGSMALGLVLSWYCINMSQIPNQSLAPVSVSWIVALPVIDAFALFIVRLSSGRHPFSADNLHFHHHFINAGYPVEKTTLLILLIGFIMGLAGVCGHLLELPDYYLAAGWVLLLVVHTVITINSGRFIDFLAKFSTIR